VGLACDDKDACTANDRCNASGKCVGQDATDWVYRFKHWGKGSYYYSRSKTSPPQGYGFDKKLFRILKEKTPLTQPFYRLHSTQYSEFMLSLNASEASTWYTNNGVLGAIYLKEQPNTVKIYRLKKKTSTGLRHLSTLDSEEGKADGFQYERTPGYVCK
jgi:hypothetical protein